MTRLEMIKRVTDENMFAELVYDLVNHTDSVEHFTELLKSEISEKELQTFVSIAQNGYSLSLEGMQ